MSKICISILGYSNLGRDEKRIAVTDEAFNDEFDLELKKTTDDNLEKMI